MSEGLAVLCPVLGRPHRVRPFLDAVERATPGARVLFLADHDDTAELEAIERESVRGDLCVKWDTGGGSYGAKVNRGVRLTGEPFVLFGADDIEPRPGWFEAAKAKLVEGVGVVGTNDLCNPRTATGDLATHPLVARWYLELGAIDSPGKPLHEGYLHEFVDQEFTETAKHRGAYAHAPDAIVEHMHPDAGKAPTDALYDARPGRMRQGRRLYRRRQHLWAQ